MVQTLQDTMQDNVGALRSEAKLKRALSQIDRLFRDLGDLPPGDGEGFDMRRIDWLDLRNMLLVARVVAEAAIARTETRGAQQREDFPDVSRDWAFNQFVKLRDGHIMLSGTPVQDRMAAS
jgi:succinate dehydrogenase/fumarate reductase flavoprotein subunit